MEETLALCDTALHTQMPMRSAPHTLSAPTPHPTPERPFLGAEKPLLGAEEDQSAETGTIARIDAILDRARALCVHHLISHKTRDMYDGMFDEIRTKRKLEWAVDSPVLLRDTIRDAKEYELRFHSTLKGALEKKWIGPQSVEKLEKHFYDEHLLECHRKQWMQETFPRFVAGWQRVAEQRQQVRLLATAMGIDADRVPELSILEQDTAFLALPFHERENRVHECRAMLHGIALRKEVLTKEARALLKAATTGKDRCLHPSKTGLWLRRILESPAPEQFLQKIVLPFLHNWQEARRQFDQLSVRLQEEGIPAACGTISLEVFLRDWTYPKRLAYLAEMHDRLDAEHLLASKATTEEEKVCLREKQTIRDHTDIRDWQGAELLLTKSRERHPEDAELARMETYIRLHRSEQEKAERVQTSVGAIVRDLRMIRQDLPVTVRELYTLALLRGPEAFSNVMKAMHAQVQHMEQTDTGKAAPVSEEPIPVLKDEAGQSDAFDRIQAFGQQRGSLEQGSNRWPRLLPDLPHGAQVHLVQSVNTKIIQYLWFLRRSGYAFSLIGEPVCRN